MDYTRRQAGGYAVFAQEQRLREREQVRSSSITSNVVWRAYALRTHLF